LQVIEELANMKIKLIALRCAGYNNVDLKACQGTPTALDMLRTHRLHDP
jgi:lactate dehydrogenase-like 2-hydroxyacid dehydrogenase